MDKEGIYTRLPLFLQNTAVSLEGARIAFRRYGGNYKRLEKEYTSRNTASTAVIQAFRDQRLSTFVKKAATEVPFWASRFKAAGLDPDSIRGLADIAALPVLEKAEVRAAPDQLVNQRVLKEIPFLMSHTSGTTGAGLLFPVTWDAHREQWAVWWRYRKWHGLERSEWCAYLGGRSIVPLSQRTAPFWRINLPGRQVLFSGYHLGPDTAIDYLKEINHRRVRWIHGYPSLISLLASRKIELKIECPQVRWITTGAERLLPSQKETIERAFGIRPREHYGMAEGAANISGCPSGSLHIDEDFAGVELLPNGNGGYRIIGTNFSNPAFPLIRYDVGDLADYVESDVCACGRPGRVVRSIDGRIEDYVITCHGARLGRMDHIFKDMVHVKEAQIRQDCIGKMKVLIVKDEFYVDKDERQLKEEIVKRVGNEVAFELCYVERIKRNGAGKLRFIVSSLQEGRL